MRYLTMRIGVALLTFVTGVAGAAAWLAGGSRTGGEDGQPRPAATTATAAGAEPNQRPERRAYPEQVDEFFTERDSLSYKGYQVERLTKSVRIDTGDGETMPAEGSYVVVKRGGRVRAKFDGVYYPAGNAAQFGLFPLLGGDEKQLIVSLTVPRGGRHWIATFSPEFRVIYDSGRSGVGREELGVIDLDGDGAYEISQSVTDFYMFENMTMAETPLPEIIFKYDERARGYVPANQLFPEYVLAGIEDEVRLLDRERPGYGYLSRRLDIALRYVYAGQEDEGWAFFDREYRRPDRAEMKAKIKEVLGRNPAYRYVRRRSAARRRRAAGGPHGLSRPVPLTYE